MSHHKIVVTETSAQPVEDIFSFLAEHQNLSKLFLLPVRRIKPGADEVNGVGSVRRLGIGPLGVEETVTAMEENRSIDYRISRHGGPIRDHRGRIEFSASPTGSQLRWSIEFTAPVAILGHAISQVLEQALRQGLRRLR